MTKQEKNIEGIKALLKGRLLDKYYHVVPDQILGKTFALFVIVPYSSMPNEFAHLEGNFTKQITAYYTPKEMQVFLEGYSFGFVNEAKRYVTERYNHIRNIKRIIWSLGEFNESELNVSSSVVYETNLPLNACIESFNDESVEVVLYDDDNEVSSFFKKYEELTDEELYEINELAEQWYKQNNEDEDE